MLKNKNKNKVKVKREDNSKIRLPRPFGLTQLMVTYRKSEDIVKEQVFTSAQDFTIQQWFMANGNLCGVNYTLNALAQFIQCDPSRIQLFMRDRLLSAKIWDGENQKELINGLMSQQIAWTLEDRMEVLNQVEILKASQGGKYAPFISGELNKSLKLKLETTTSLQSLIRSMGGGSTTNIFAQINNNNNGAEEQEKTGLTYEQAIVIINHEFGELSLEGKTLKHIEATYDITNTETFPTVVASQQHDIDTTKEGLNLAKRDITIAIDNYQGNLGDEAKKDFHEIRREVQLRILEEDEDPELEQYEEPA